MRVEPAPAWVAFVDAAAPAWLKLLRPGMRHCLIFLAGNGFYLRIDPLLNLTQVEILSKPQLDWQFRLLLAGGAVILPVDRSDAFPPRRLGLPLHSCVEVVKRLLAIDDRRVLTPYGLLQYLLEQKMKRHLDLGGNSI